MRSVSAASSGVSVSRSSPFASTCVRAGERDGALRPLLDEEHADAALRDGPQGREDEVDDRRREAERRLVEQQDRRPRHRSPGRSRAAAAGRPRAHPRAGGGTPRRPGTARRPRRGRPRRRSELARAASPSRRFSSTRQLAEEPPALRDERDPAPRDRLRRPPAERLLAEPDLARRGPGTSPMTAWSVVDFPAPFGPMSPTISPGATVSDTPRTATTPPYATSRSRNSRALTSVLLHRRLAEVGRRDVEVPADLARRALGQRPSLVEHLDPVADVHDQRHVVIDEEHARVVVVAHRAHDLGERRHLRLGKACRRLVHEDEARLGGQRARDAQPALVAVRQRAGRGVGVRGRAAASRGAPSARLRASRGPAPTPSAATSTFSRTESPRNDRLCWKVRESPARPRRSGRQRVTSRPSSSTAPSSGKSKPVRTFTSVDFPAPFGPMSPTTSWRWSSSVTSRSACTPSNARETPAARSEAPDRRVSFRLCFRQAPLRSSGRPSP